MLIIKCIYVSLLMFAILSIIILCHLKEKNIETDIAFILLMILLITIFFILNVKIII